MKLRTLLLVLPAALLSLMLAVVATLAFQAGKNSALMDRALVSAAVSDATKQVSDACDAMTQRTVIWTVSRRNSERKLVADARKACVEGVPSLIKSIPDEREAIEQLAAKAKELASLLENIQSEYSDEMKVAIVGRLEREVKPLAKSLGDGLGSMNERAQKQSADAMEEIARKQRETLLFALGAGAVALVMGCVLTLIVIRRTMHPITSMQAKMTEIATNQDFTQRMDISRNDEIGLSMVAFNTMIAKIQESSELVRQKTADIHAMLHYVPQGIMSLKPGGLIHPEFSEHLKAILERDDLAGQDVMSVIFNNSDLGDDIRSQVETAISACIGEDEMNFAFNSHLLPTEINLAQANGASKVLDLNWSPITDDTGTILRLLLCVRDVTEQRALARAAEAQQRELTIIGEILGVQHEKFHEFIEGAEQFIAENRSIVSGPDAPAGADTKGAVGLLYRNMHTIKGNARTHGLLTLTNVVHRAEQTYDNLRNGTGTWDSAQLLAELNEVATVVGEYAAINHDKLGRRGPGRRGNPDQFALVPRETVQRLIARLEDLPGSSAAAIEAAMLETRAALRQFGTERVTDVLSGVVDSLPSLARELGKEPPVTRIADDDVVVRSQLSSTLRNVFMHLYRNALDHGIESTADRQRAGKSPAGRIDLDVTLTADTLRMVMRDDGRGLALQRIRRKAIERGMLDDAATPAAADLARLILEPGFSTADKVTEVSGRGVGMDAVRGFIEAEGGTLELVVKPEVSGDAEYGEFETVISLPRALAEQALA